MIESRAKLLDVFAELAGKFTQVSEQVKELEAAREKHMVAIEAASKANPLQQSRLRSKEPLYEMTKDMLEAVRSETRNWRKEMASYEKCTSFRERYGDSLLVYIYGKVKSGKSSLCNYLAYGFHNPQPEQIQAYPDVKVFFQDDSGMFNAQAGEVHDSRCLKVDFLETTSAIQGYLFPGITLIDSPGIHSKTSENGALAREYLKSADLVLYTSSGKSALRTTDLEELKTMMDARKSFVLLATKCSNYEEDEDEHGNITQDCVMFPAHEQEDVRQWSLGQCKLVMKADNADDSDMYNRILPISTLYAEINPDAQGWETSGMARLASYLAKAAQQDGVRIKKQAPLQNLRSYNAKVLQSLQELEEKNNEVQAGLARVLKNMEQEKERQQIEQSLALMAKIEQLENCGTDQDQSFQEKAKQAAQHCADEANAAIAAAFVNSTTALVRNPQSTIFQNISLPAFEDVYQEIRYNTSTYKRAGAFLGTLVGAVGGAFGGPPGVILGSIAGGIGGGKAGAQFDGDAMERLKTGNNSADVRRAACSALEKAMSDELDATISVLAESCLHPIQHWCAELNMSLLALKTQLHVQQNILQKELEE